MINKMYMIPDIVITNPDNSHIISNLKKEKMDDFLYYF